MKKVYIAGPLFTPGDRWFLEEIDRVCKDKRLATYLPHRDAGVCPPSGEGGANFFQSDLAQLRDCDLVIAILNGSDVDAGTAWEMGYAYSIKKPILGFFDDTRIYNPEANINLMIFHSMQINKSIDELSSSLEKYQ